MDAPVFISTDLTALTNDYLQRFEALTGRTLQPAQVERLILNFMAYREQLLRQGIQYSAEQNLVLFANGLALDNLGKLVGVTRQAARPAECTLLFFVDVATNPGVIIPEGTRVATSDGLVVFRTSEQLVLPEGIDSGAVNAKATVSGTRGNGYPGPSVNQLLDPLPYVTSVVADVETDGGADEETDEGLRERIILASGQFTTAGSRQAYAYHTRTVSQTIVDVAVLSADPGTVQIYLLMEDGENPAPEIVAAVQAATSDERVRPLNDLVTVNGATAVEYELEIETAFYADADAQITAAAQLAAVEAFVLRKRQSLGQDVPLSQVIEAAMVEGVYSVEVTGFTSLVIGAAEFAKCTSIVINLNDPVDE